MHEYEYQVPPQAMWEWDDGQSMYPPNTNEPMVIYRGADSRFTPPVSETEEEGTLVLTIRTRDDRHVWHQTLSDLTEEIIIPADVTKDMKEGRHYYFYDIMARALSASGVEDVGGHRWKEELAARLVSLQRPDGSWCNDNNRFWEGDPVLCTSFAMLALELCR